MKGNDLQDPRTKKFEEKIANNESGVMQSLEVRNEDNERLMTRS